MNNRQTILVTGGAGFIGSALIRQFLSETDAHIVNVDKLTYAGNLETLASVAHLERYSFEQVDVSDDAAMHRLFQRYAPDAVMHLAAESHVDRSIDGPADFIRTNIVGTAVLLEVARNYLKVKGRDKRDVFRFFHVSTDEVYGSVRDGERFTESSPHRPNSPYAASKASADHLVRAWHRTYNLPVIITNCGNNYGPFQFPEKLVPLMIATALAEKPLPVYGDGQNVRDWIYVGDHCTALRQVLAKGRVGETYLIGANSPVTNLDLVHRLCSLLDERQPRHNGKRYAELISFVSDRPGHDHGYALNTEKVVREIGWRPAESLDSGLRKTVDWYLQNQRWYEGLMRSRYRGERLGTQL
jgi:dTDP-glucose 4,6-dehydratase